MRVGEQLVELRGVVAIPELVDLARAMFVESRFSHLEFSQHGAENHAWAVLDRFAGNPWLGFGVLVEGKLVGMVIGLCGPILPFTSDIVATQHFLYLLPAYRGGNWGKRLIDAFVSRAKTLGAKDIIFSNGFGGGDSVDKLFEHCGLQKTGSIFTVGD